MEQSCFICLGTNGHVVYSGAIRNGPPGVFAESYGIWECSNCGVQRLDPFPIKVLDAYESGSYRDAYNGSQEVENYYLRHDKEQSKRLSLIGAEKFRGKTVIDVGCGAGSFLDLVKGFSEKTIAIEPTRAYHDHLGAGHDMVYPLLKVFLSDESNCEIVDVATSFAVIEHVERPLEFLKEVARSLKSGGSLFLTTPNRDEVLMTLGRDKFQSHFYRTAHLWYFNLKSLQSVAALAGFKVSSVKSYHNYNFMNFVTWVRDGQARGNQPINKDLFSDFDLAWKSKLESIDWGDQIFAHFEKI